jgi:hypothetical protein
VHPNQISEWKRRLLEAGGTLFSRDGARHHREEQEREGELYEQIGRLKVELEWLKKNYRCKTHSTYRFLKEYQRQPAESPGMIS